MKSSQRNSLVTSNSFCNGNVIRIGNEPELRDYVKRINLRLVATELKGAA